MRALAERVMMGPRHAIILTVVLNAIPLQPVQFVGIALIALVALRLGSQSALMVAGWSLLPLGLWTVVFGGPPIMIVLLIAAMIGALVLRQTDSWRAVLIVALGHGAVLMLVVAPLSSEWFQQMMAPVVAIQEPYAPEGVTARQLYEIALAYFGAAHVVVLLAVMMLARWWQSVLYNPQAFGQEMRALRLTPIFVLGLIVTSGLCIAVGMAQAIVLLFVPLLVAGLALIHWLVEDREMGVGPLVAMYVVLVLLNQLVVPLVLLLSLLDSSLDLRKRLAVEHKRDE